MEKDCLVFRRLENSKGSTTRSLKKSKLKNEYRIVWASLDHNINKTDSKDSHYPSLLGIPYNLRRKTCTHKHTHNATNQEVGVLPLDASTSRFLSVR
jgi:hypothetical protein